MEGTDSVKAVKVTLIAIVVLMMCFAGCIIPMDCLTYGGLFKGEAWQVLRKAWTDQ
jgi:hypothetical protein